MDAVGVGRVFETGGVVEDGGENAGGSIGGGGDDASSGGVFFVHGEGVEVDPIENGEWVGEVGFGVSTKFLVLAGGTSGHLESAGQDAGGVTATGDAVLHGLPDAVELGAGFFFGADGVFVGEGEFGDGEVVFPTEVEELVAGVVGKGDEVLCVGGVLGTGPEVQFTVGHDEAAAEGVDDFFLEDVFIFIEGEEVHAVGVAREGVESMESEVGFGVESDVAVSGDGEGLGVADFFQQLRDIVDGDGFGKMPEKAEDDGAVGVVSFASGGERAVEITSQGVGFRF